MLPWVRGSFFENEMKATREERERIAASAASDWCRCFKCDRIINETGMPCDKPSGVTCLKYRDGYKTALIALEKYERAQEQEGQR